MHVQIAADRVARDQHGQRSASGRLDLVVSVSNLRRNPRQLERRVDLLFRLRQQCPAVAAIEAFGFERPALRLRQTAEALEVRGAPGQMQKCRARSLRLRAADAHLDAVREQVQTRAARDAGSA